MTRRRALRAGIALTAMLALGGPACGRYGPPVRRPPASDAGAPDVAQDGAPDARDAPDERDERDEQDQTNDERNDGAEQERDAGPTR